MSNLAANFGWAEGTTSHQLRINSQWHRRPPRYIFNRQPVAELNICKAIKKSIQIIKKFMPTMNSIWEKMTQIATELKYTNNSGWIECLGSHHLRPILTCRKINCGKLNPIMGWRKNVIRPAKESRSQFHHKKSFVTVKNIFSTPAERGPGNKNLWNSVTRCKKLII